MVAVHTIECSFMLAIPTIEYFYRPYSSHHRTIPSYSQFTLANNPIIVTVHPIEYRIILTIPINDYSIILTDPTIEHSFMLANRTIKCPVMRAIHTVECAYHACKLHYQIFLPCLQSTLSDDPSYMRFILPNSPLCLQFILTTLPSYLQFTPRNNPSILAVHTIEYSIKLTATLSMSHHTYNSHFE
jgi:hypothetical protein